MQLEVLECAERCPTCFKEKTKNIVCLECHHSKSPFLGLASVFEYEGPAASLIKKLKYGKQDYLAQSMGAYLAAQFIHLNWPIPDIIIPVPISTSHYFMRGFNQSELLAKSLSMIIQRPLLIGLGRYSGDYSQAGLSHQQRNTLGKTSLIIFNKENISNKIVLLIDDVATTGQTLKRCGETLQLAKPKAIYGLTFCKAKE